MGLWPLPLVAAVWSLAFRLSRFGFGFRPGQRPQPRISVGSLRVGVGLGLGICQGDHTCIGVNVGVGVGVGAEVAAGSMLGVGACVGAGGDNFDARAEDGGPHRCRGRSSILVQGRMPFKPRSGQGSEAVGPWWARRAKAARRKKSSKKQSLSKN